MRFKTLILSSLLFSALLAMTAFCIDWESGTVTNVDDMFHSGEDEQYLNPSGAPATPQEARDLQKNKSALNWSMPSTLSAGGESAKESRDQAEATTETQTTASVDENITSDSQTSSAQAGTANVQGNWFFTLNDSMIRELALTLLQNGTDVYGSGRIKEGNNSMDVAVSGTAAGSDLMLNLVSTNPIAQYKLNFTVDQDLASGEYQASSAGGESWMGTAEGQKTA
jgi:hypothetical protein